jgi:ubiquinone/menaquinone biosynthesis C-methylase UbiE
MSAVDPFGMTDRLDEALIQAIVTRLEARARHPFFARMLEEYLDAMGIDAARSVLDMGCGTGVAARAIARRPRFAGRVVGIDLSPALVEAAKRFSSDEGLAGRVEFNTGDTRTLDFSDGTFDSVVAHTLLSHVADPLVVVQEAARLVKPGGMVGIFDGDYASITFGHEDPVKGKAYDETFINAIVSNPRVMRQMPRLLREAGLELVASYPYVLAEIGKADFWLSAIESLIRKLVPKAGTMTEADASAWADTLLKDSEAGVFFGASNYYSYVARRPSDNQRRQA